MRGKVNGSKNDAKKIVMMQKIKDGLIRNSCSYVIIYK